MPGSMVRSAAFWPLVAREVVQPLRLRLRQLFQPDRHGLASQVASYARPSECLLLTGVDREGDDLVVCHGRAMKFPKVQGAGRTRPRRR